MILYLYALLLAGYTEDEAGRVAAAYLLAERDRRRAVEEYAGEVEAERVEVTERQWNHGERKRNE